MSIKNYELKCWIANPEQVWGYSAKPDSYVWAVASALSNYSKNTNVIYNSSLKAFMLKPLPGATNMTLTSLWTSVAGSWKNILPPDLTGTTFARQYHKVDWGIKSASNIILYDSSFSVYIRRPKIKIRPSDEYTTIELNDGTGTGNYSRKFKFYLDGTIEFLTNGTVTQSLNVSSEDLQKWRESNVIQLDFYTLGNGKILITSPLFSDAFITDRVIDVNAYIQINGKYAALVGFSLYTFPTTGSMVWNSMGINTDGSDESGVTPVLRIFPEPPTGNTVTATYTYPANGTFKATLAIAGTGRNPVLIQAAEFGFKHTWSTIESIDWYNISQYVTGMTERVGEDITDREINLSLMFKNNTEAQAFSTSYLLCSGNPFVASAAFLYEIIDPDTAAPVYSREGIMKLSQEAHSDGEFYIAEANIYSRLFTNLSGDAMSLPVTCGANPAAWWVDALGVGGFHPDYISCADLSSFFADSGWDYDKLERGDGKTMSEYLRELARSRGYILDDKTAGQIAIRELLPAAPTVFELTTESDITDLTTSVEGITREFGSSDYCNSLAIIEDKGAAQWIHRAYCPAAITADHRIIHQVISRNDLTLTGTGEAVIELQKKLQLTESVTVDIPPLGLNNLWPGSSSIYISTAHTFAMGSPNGKTYPVIDVDMSFNSEGVYWTITGTITGKRNISTISISSESTYYPIGGEAAKAREINNGAWKQKEKAKKEKHKKKKHVSPKKKVKLAKWQKL
jgi:hypothetical protein